MIDFYYWPTPNGWEVAIMLARSIELLPQNQRATGEADELLERSQSVRCGGLQQSPLIVHDSFSCEQSVFVETHLFVPVPVSSMWKMRSTLSPV